MFLHIRFDDLQSRGRSDGSGRGSAVTGDGSSGASRADSGDEGRRDGSLSLVELLLSGELRRGQELENLGELLLGVLDTAANGLSDLSEDLLNLVLGLDVSDCLSAQALIVVSQPLTPDLVEEGRAGGELSVVNTVRSELGAETRIGPGEVRGRGRLLVLGRHQVDELKSARFFTLREALTSSRLASVSDLR